MVHISIRVQRKHYLLRLAAGVGEHNLVIELIAVNRFVGGAVGYGQTVGLDVLTPYRRVVALRTTEQITDLTRGEAAVDDIPFGGDDVFGTFLSTSRQRRSVGEQ